MPKIMVMYPYPSDVEKFDRDYTDDHAPMVTGETFPKITKFIANKVAGTPDGSQPQYRLIAELHFASMEDLAGGGFVRHSAESSRSRFRNIERRSARRSDLRRGYKNFLISSKTRNPHAQNTGKVIR